MMMVMMMGTCSLKSNSLFSSIIFTKVALSHLRAQLLQQTLSTLPLDSRVSFVFLEAF